MKNMKLILATLLLYSFGYAQQSTVTGVVLDEANVPIPGVNVVVKGTNIGALTDFDGKFSLTLSEGREIIEFSFLGFIKQEINVKGKKEVTINMKEDISQLDEVVVVGYGVQKKINLTGSVETVQTEELTRQPVLQTSQALVGLVPGLTVTQDSGQPGLDGGTLRIRGIGTLGAATKNDPLILVDGIQGDLNSVDSNDIESISVLKDASAAAIYGSRAANGVILVTTKRGKDGKISVSYNTYIGVQDITEQINIVDGLDYIEARNLISPGFYSDELVANYTANSGTDEFPDNDWVDLFFSETGYQKYHNLSVNGGSEKVKAAASISYQDQDGNAPGFNFERISGRFNVDFKVTDNFDIGFDINTIQSTRTEPAVGLGNLFEGGIYRTQPVLGAINSDGTWAAGFAGRNPIARAVDGGSSDLVRNYFRAVLKAVYKPVEGLSLALTYAPEVTDVAEKSFIETFPFSDFADPELGSRFSGQENVVLGAATLEERRDDTFQETFNLIANYNTSFADHNFGATFGYEFINFDFSRIVAQRVGFDLEDFPELNNGDPETQTNEGFSTLRGLESFFGRVNYNYKSKYLIEANLRRDGSSRFAEENRVSYFPSVSVGWNIDKESFFPESSSINSLKLRGSWGELGNQGTDSNFPYTALIDLGASQPIIGGSPLLGGAQQTLANSLIQWETTETANLGVDATFFNNRLSFTGEIYTRRTKDILLDVTIPTSNGLNAPVQNAGDVENNGWDVALGWNDAIGKVKYGVRFNISDYKNEITNLNGLDELPSEGDQINRLGESIGSLYGLNVVGFYEDSDFATDGSLLPGVTSSSFGAVRPGDYKYEDITGDGVVSDDDRQILGSPLSRLNYGLDLFAEVKGFDFNASFIGVGDRDVQIKRFIGFPVINESAWATLQEWQNTNFWTPDNPDARYSRFEGGLNSAHNFRLNSRYVYNAAYFRLRNLTVGYSLPTQTTTKMGISGLRFYVSGQNLFTIEDLPEGIDPTIPDNTQGNFFPITSIYTLGLNLKF